MAVGGAGKEGELRIAKAFLHRFHQRIGFGGGYYDKYLELYPELFTAAVAFGFQIVEGVPTEANDIRPQKLITEERIYE